MQLSLSPCHFLPPTSNRFLSTPFLNTLKRCSLYRAETKLTSTVYEILRFTLLSLIVICDKNANPLWLITSDSAHMHSSSTSAGDGHPGRGIPTTCEQSNIWFVSSQHLPETKQKPVSETWTLTLIANQVTDKAQTVCFSTGNNIIFVL